LGISVEAKNALIEWAIKGGKAADVEKYLAYSKMAGKFLGVTTVLIDYANLRENPTTANKIRFGVDIALLFAGPEASAISGVLDISGASNSIYNYLGSKTDSGLVKLSNMYNSVQQSANPTNWIHIP